MNGALPTLFFPLCLCLIAGGSTAEELRFCSLKQGQHSLPSLTAPLLLARSSSVDPSALRLAQEDYLSRMKMRPRLHEESWPLAAGEPEQATLCVIHSLAETASLSFQFPWEKAVSGRLEIRIPKGPGLGPFSVSLKGDEVGTIDPWARERAQPEWVPLRKTVQLNQGINTLTITQKSAQDLPIWLDSLRVVAEGGK